MEVNTEYGSSLSHTTAQLFTTWMVKLDGLATLTKEFYESEGEFAARVAKERTQTQAAMKQDLDQLRVRVEEQRAAQASTLTKQLNDAVRNLESKTWTLKGPGIEVVDQGFNAETKVWTFQVVTTDPTMPLDPQTLAINLTHSKDLRAAALAIDTAVKARALAGEVTWSITRDPQKNRYAMKVQEVLVRNLGTNTILGSLKNLGVVGHFTAGNRAFGTLTVQAPNTSIDILVDGERKGSGMWTGRVATGTRVVEVKNAIGRRGIAIVKIDDGKNSIVNIELTPLEIGSIGPAGGIIFYYKEDNSKGWRYLEAAPTDQSESIKWYNDTYIDIIGAKVASVGSGRENTKAVIEVQGSGNYAAQLCNDLVFGGFDDWFLPSIDELYIMFRNLKQKNIGNFRNNLYWSSTQTNKERGCTLNFENGIILMYDRTNYRSFVRAVRAFSD